MKIVLHVEILLKIFVNHWYTILLGLLITKGKCQNANNTLLTIY